MAEAAEIGDVRMILHSKVIVLAEDNHRLGDDYPLQPSLSKQAAHRSSECGVGWVYRQLGNNDGNNRLNKVLSISKTCLFPRRYNSMTNHFQ